MGSNSEGITSVRTRVSYVIHLRTWHAMSRSAAELGVSQRRFSKLIRAVCTHHNSNSFCRGVQHRLRQERPMLACFCTLPGIRNLSISRFQHDSPAAIKIKAREDNTGRNTVRTWRRHSLPLARSGCVRPSFIGRIPFCMSCSYCHGNSNLET